MTWTVPGCPGRGCLRVLLGRLRGAGCGAHRSRCPLFHQEAMPIRSRYQGGAYTPCRIMRLSPVKGAPRRASAAAVGPSEATCTTECVLAASLTPMLV